MDIIGLLLLVLLIILIVSLLQGAARIGGSVLWVVIAIELLFWLF
jgi:hypothetical protein